MWLFFTYIHYHIEHKKTLLSAANDFWGKTFLSLSGETKMTQQLSILTGCSAGATESFVVVPFELVKIKYVFDQFLEPDQESPSTSLPIDYKTNRVLMQDLWTSSDRLSGRMVF